MADSAARNIPSVRILGVRVHDVDAEDIVAFITRACLDHKKAVVANVNVQAMNIAYGQAWFQDFLNQCELVFCDGFGISLASVFLGQGWIHRNTPPDWMEVMMPAAAQNDLSLFFVGTKADIVEEAAQVYQNRFPGLRILGCHDGYFVLGHYSTSHRAVVEEV